MSGTLSPTIAVLFDHELREAAAALQKAWGLVKDGMDDDNREEAQKTFGHSLHVAHAALHAISPAIDAIVVIKLAEAIGKQAGEDTT